MQYKRHLPAKSQLSSGHRLHEIRVLNAKHNNRLIMSFHSRCFGSNKFGSHLCETRKK
jgi:hypothetical protein